MNSEYKKMIGMYILIYVLQFVIAPLVTNVYFIGTKEGYLIFVISFIIMIGITMQIISDKFCHWIIGFSVYVLLAIIYTPLKIYAPELSGEFSRDVHDYAKFARLIVTIVDVLIINFVIWLFFKARNLIIRKYNYSKDVK